MDTFDWDGFNKVLIDNSKIDEAIKLVDADKRFVIKSRLEISPLEKGETKGTVYDSRSDKMFAVGFENNFISANKRFVLNSLKSQKLKQNLIDEKGDTFTFFDFQFMLYLHRAADVSSGFTWFRNSVKEIVNSLKKGNANLNGVEIKNEDELNDYLKEKIYGFESLFKSVEKIKNYA